jgi:hypothetical protein
MRVIFAVTMLAPGMASGQVGGRMKRILTAALLGVSAIFTGVQTYCTQQVPGMIIADSEASSCWGGQAVCAYQDTGLPRVPACGSFHLTCAVGNAGSQKGNRVSQAGRTFSIASKPCGCGAGNWTKYPRCTSRIYTTSPEAATDLND